MGTFENPKSNQERVVKRVMELARDGYIVRVAGHWELTEKGWGVLGAFAPRPLIRPTTRVV